MKILFKEKKNIGLGSSIEIEIALGLSFGLSIQL